MSVAKATREQLGAAVHQNKALSRTGMLERMFSSLFQGLVYAQIWEDPDCDMEALEITPEKNLVSISSGGCNMMSYLSRSPASILVVDLSPAHVALARLKLKAAEVLTQEQFYDLFGHADRASNPALFDSHLAPELDETTRNYWQGRRVLARRINMFARGFYRYGVLGRFLTSAHWLAWLGGVKFDKLLAARTLEEQQAFYDSEIAPQFKRPLVKFLARRRAALFGLGIPPAQYDKLAADGEGDVLPVLQHRIRKLICDFPVSENYFAWAAFNRGYRSDGTGPLPPYLQARHFDAVKAAAANVEVHNISLTEALAACPVASKHGYVLLDAQDWMTDTQLNALWAEITRTAADGARVVFRTGGVPDILPGRVRQDILDRWEYQPDLSTKLSAEDRSAIYGATHVYVFRG
ncbi:DUF3419 family protein [Algicella marina]|uniref:DUF3419 family protein n=1 Tax=Algicella marina TaxID=2683284 RepID=A0A6P1T1L8_9RHOB|nr:DUF3419 family protein [Algicella marina]QHQ36628.1 DUF3419 family protein [Algicella marina]